MKLLLDTHTFLWWFSDRKQLSDHVIDVCMDRTNSLLLSVVSAWEIQIKVGIGKLALAKPLRDIIADELNAQQITLLSVDLRHVLQIANLPMHHKDPFDRMLVAQAVIEKAVIVTRDSEIAKYPLTTPW